MKAAIFSCKGLGDGLISAALANNLCLNNYQVDLFHNTLGEMQCFFKNFKIKKYPNITEIDSILADYDQIFVSFDESNISIMNLIKTGKESYPKKMFVLNPCPSKKIGAQPYYEDACFSSNICMVDNIDMFCRQILKLKKTTKKIAYILPTSAIYKKYKNRIIIHPSSAKESKNWTLEKYIQLAKVLKKKGFNPVFVVSENEKSIYSRVKENNLVLKSFDNLKDLSLFTYESSYMIGNDSGIGHLSSMFGLPTISIFRNYRSAKLWRPGWSKNIIIYPNSFIPNLSIYRLRDKHWKIFISVKKILSEFPLLTSAISQFVSDL